MVPRVKWNLNSKIKLVFAVVSLCLALIGSASYLDIHKLQDSTEWVQNSHHSLQSLQKIYTDFKSLQASYALYLLTRKPSDAQSCRRDIQSLHQDMETTKELLVDEPVFQSRLEALEALIQRKVLSSEEGLALCEAGQCDRAIDRLKRSNEKKQAQEVKDQVSHTTTARAWMIKSRLSLQERSTQENLRWMTAGLSFTFIICAAAAFLIQRQTRAHQRTIDLLGASEEKFRFLSETANDSFLTMDSTGLLTDMNPASETFFGYSKEELLGQSITRILSSRFLEESGDHPFEAFLEMTVKPGIRTIELYMLKQDGSEFPVEISVSRWTSREGTFYSLIARDITERKFFVKTLLTNEHRLFQFLDAVPMGILVRDKLGMHYFANKTARDILGRDIQRDRVPPQEIPRLYQIYQTGTDEPYPAEHFPMVLALTGEKSHLDDLEIRRADKTIPIEAWGTPILDENGGVKFSLTAIIDVTHQRDTTQSLREREEFFRNLFEEGPIGMNLSFPDTSLASVNRSFSEMLGYTKDELIGKSFLELTHPEDVPTDRALAKKLFDKILPRYQLEKRFLTKSGAVIWCKVSASSILDLEGTPLFRLSIVENITEQRDSEIALKQSEERFRALTDSANDAIVSATDTGNIIYFNQAATKLFGYTSPEALNRPFSFLMPAGITQEQDEEFRRAFAGGTSKLTGRTSEWTGLTKEGREFPLELSLYTWFTDQGIFATAIMRDITERKQIDDMKRDLISVVSHQLKTPVAEINGYLDNLLEGLAGDLTEKQREYLADMREIGAENYRLISDLLNMSKIERGVITVDPEPVPLSEILELALRDYEDTIRKKGLKLEVKNAQNLVDVLADKDKTVETIRNIVNNAVKCTDKGGITLQVHAEDGFSLVEIRDTGIGMGPETLAKLFTRERVMGQEAARAGAGLGLYIAKSFMKLQNGDITVKSEKGKGTSFFVKIPNTKKEGAL